MLIRCDRAPTQPAKIDCDRGSAWQSSLSVFARGPGSERSWSVSGVANDLLVSAKHLASSINAVMWLFYTESNHIHGCRWWAATDRFCRVGGLGDIAANIAGEVARHARRVVGLSWTHQLLMCVVPRFRGKRPTGARVRPLPPAIGQCAWISAARHSYRSEPPCFVRIVGTFWPQVPWASSHLLPGSRIAAPPGSGDGRDPARPPPSGQATAVYSPAAWGADVRPSSHVMRE